MKSLRLATALLAAVLPTIAIVLPASPAQAQTITHLKVMPLGDSITLGVGSSPQYGYRPRLLNLVSDQGRYTIDYVGSMTSDAPMADMDHEGHSGWTIAQMRSNIDTWMRTEQPDVVLLHAGINDLNKDQVSAATAVSRLTDLVNRIILNRPDVTIVLSGLIPKVSGLEDKITAVNAGARQIASNEAGQGNKVRYVDMPVTPAQMYDRLHPNNAGYVTMANSYFAGLSQVVADGWAVGTFDSFSGDAQADLVVHSGSVVAIRNGVSSGGFDAGSEVTSGWGRYHGLDVTEGLGQLYFADYDGDHRTDLVVHDGSNVNVRLNTGAGRFDGGRTVTTGYGRYHGLHVPNGLGRLYFADYNGDGRDDLVIHDGSNVNVRLNLNTGGFDANRTVTTGYGRYHGLQVPDGLGQLYFADYNGDHRDDLVVHDGSNINVRLNLKTGGFDAGRTVTTGYGRYHGLQVPDGLGQLYFADYNGDSKDDLVIHDGTDVNVRLNTATGGFDGGRTVTTGYGRYHGLQVPDGLGRLYFT
ncbi:FG-GAP-like repeat-containing protein [Actinoplanes sp. GCM10030250]|uniref:FG-GAP-like repeat-containing protein n=1 Tax=Actinoplanes sp. GCM10030250 TaxID=3273376 RepID=UPI00361A3237